MALAQLLALGLSREAVKRRVRAGRWHRVHRGVFAVGHPRLTREGRWLAAVLACGPGAVLGHPLGRRVMRFAHRRINGEPGVVAGLLARQLSVRSRWLSTP